MEVRRSPELEGLANEAFRAWQTGDDAWFAARLADGEVASYGTAPGEVWRGREEILALNRDRVREMNEEVGIVDDDGVAREVEAYEAGDTGVIVTHTSFLLEDGSAVPLRSVTVLAREGGEWKTVVGGAHVLVANELIGPGSPIATAGAAGR
jgi:hypothetical protein